MRTQHVDYAVLDTDYNRDQTGLPGHSGYTDRARFVFHFLDTAYLFGEHDGRTLVVEFLTFGFGLRFRLEQTRPKKCRAYSDYAPPGCGLEKGHGGIHVPEEA